jgi:hypothetical protein
MINLPKQRHFPEKAQKLAMVIYKITDLLDDQEPLRQDLRRESVALFSQLNLAAKGVYDSPARSLEQNLQRIIASICILKGLDAMKNIRLDILEKSYQEMASEIEKIPQELVMEKPISASVKTGGFETSNRNDVVVAAKDNKKEPNIHGTVRMLSRETPPAKEEPSLTDRQQFVLRFAITHRRFQLKELSAHFPSLSEKTIRNDLLALCDYGLVRRFGIAPRSYYQVMPDAAKYVSDAEAFVGSTEIKVTA